MSKPLKFLPEVGVLGTGSALGSILVDNAALRERVRNYDESSGDFEAWVERVTHIQTRRIAAEGESVATLGTAAARRAVEASGVDPAEIDLVLVATFTATNLYPGDHVDIARAVNPRCGVIKLSGGCAGSVYGVALALGMVKSGFARNVLVLGVEHLTPTVDWGDPLTAILFGDGAGAVVVGRRTGAEPESGFLDRTVLRHDHSPDTITMDNANLGIPSRLLEPASGTGGVRRQYLRMGGGPRVLRNAINAMAEVTVELLGYTMEDLKNDDPGLRARLDEVFLVPHQANGRIVDGLQEKLGMAEDRVYRTVYTAGNMSSATNLYTLDFAVRTGNLKREALEDGRGRVSPCGRRLRTGDLVVLTTIGGGYLFGAVGFRVA